MHLRFSLRTAGAALAALAWAAALVAQQPAAAPAPLDAKTLRQYENLLNYKFSRDLNEVFGALEKAAKDDSRTPVDVRFLQAFRLGDWPRVRAELRLLPPDLARRIYDKMLNDLLERRLIALRLDDALALVDAVPGELTDDEVRKIGQLLSNVLAPGDAFWLSERLAKGTAQLGGGDAVKRLRTARMLIAGGFKELAKTYLPDAAQLAQIQDEAVKAELQTFLSAEEATDAQQRDQVQRIWDENIRLLSQDRVNDWERTKAGAALARIMMQVPPSTLGPSFRGFLKDHPDSAISMVGGLVRKVQNESRGDPAVRADNLRAQATLANLLVEQVDVTQKPWDQYVQIMAETWITEAEAAFAQRNNGGARQRGAKGSTLNGEDLLSFAPAGKWVAALGPEVRGRFDAALSHAILVNADFDAASERILELSKRHPQAAIALAEDFISAWAQAHNPQLPEELRKKYGLPEETRIPVTPVMMERNIDSLARMMGLFRQAGIAPRDYNRVVTAFDLAYSNAEAYRESHLEKVFGPIPQLSEQVFFLITQRMQANLSDRWRKPETQKVGLTRRTDTQTYEMVSAGYAQTLRMVDQWLAGRTDSARALTFAGGLLCEWGDYEFFQELAPMDTQKRLLAYKERNLQSQEYFQRAVDAYGRDVLRKNPADYSIDIHLAWFNTLLGIGPNGNLNLGKTMNRAALGRIRTSLQALPGKAAATHLSMLAKVLNARLADEREPLHEDLKYRYLASALVVTKDDPFTLGLQKKVAYFDELLSEIRLQTRVDGPNTVGVDQEFGILVSVLHTEAMGRVARFSQYLSHESPAAVGPGGQPKAKQRRSLTPRKGKESAGARDDFEIALTEALAPFFDVRSITFSAPDVKPRPSARPGWEETTLAYILVKAKDASVDKVPPVSLDLKFLDLSGPVTIPASSAETLLKVQPGLVAPRPAQKVEVLQTLDTRQFAINGTLTLEIKATAQGLVPELDMLLDLEPLRKVAEVRQVTPHEGLLIRELSTWGDQVGPRSERLWTITLDGDPIRARNQATEVPFPAARSKDVAVVWQTFEDQDLKVLPKSSVLLDRVKTAPGAGLVAAAEETPLWAYALGGLVLLAGGLFLALRPKGPPAPKPLRARDVFKLPASLDGFAVVALLRRMGASPLMALTAPQKQELTADLERVQSACFGAADAMAETDLQTVAEKWLRLAR
jgi:hypothetical protein